MYFFVFLFTILNTVFCIYIIATIPSSLDKEIDKGIHSLIDEYVEKCTDSKINFSIGYYAGRYDAYKLSIPNASEIKLTLMVWLFANLWLCRYIFTNFGIMTCIVFSLIIIFAYIIIGLIFKRKLNLDHVYTCYYNRCVYFSDQFNMCSSLDEAYSIIAIFYKESSYDFERYHTIFRKYSFYHSICQLSLIVALFLLAHITQ